MTGHFARQQRGLKRLDQLALHCGDLIDVPLRLRTPDVYRDPGAWSYADYLLEEGIGATGSARSSRVQVLHTARPTLRCRIFAAQAWASDRLQSFANSNASHHLPQALRLTSEDASMLNAMLFGDRTHLTRALREAFERTGTFHLFVVSGLHVALLAGGLFWFLRRLRLPQGIAVLLTILVAFGYAELTGFGIPAQRALIMTAIYLIARWLDREITALNGFTIGDIAFGDLSAGHVEVDVRKPEVAITNGTFASAITGMISICQW